MSYLYGDSTPSPFEINFIQYLRDLADAGAQLLPAEQQLLAEVGRVADRRKTADAELARVEGLAGLVQRVLDETAKSAPDSPSGRCAGAIMRSATELVRAETEKSKTVFSDALSKMDLQVGKEREACAKALEKLLLKQDLVGSKPVLTLQLRGGTRFEARWTMSTAYGVEATLDLEVPAAHVFARPVRLDRFVEQLEMETAEGSWLSKETKLRPHRFEKYHLLEAALGADQAILKLRQGPDGNGRGFDLKLRRQPAQGSLLRVDDPPKAGDQPAELKAPDVAKFLSLCDSLMSAAADLSKNRRSLLQAAVDGRSLKDHDRPSVILERIVTSMAPLIQEIARRSPSPSELVLKRLLGDDRREEIFLSKEEFRKKVEAVSPAMLRILDPLGLFQSAPAPVVTGAPVPPPEEAASSDPRSQSEMFHKRAIARMKVGETTAALLDFDRAIHLRPDYSEAYVNRATARQTAGDMGGAISDLEAALRVAPTGWKYRERIEHLLEVARQQNKVKT
jgi:hypothetical protein